MRERYVELREAHGIAREHVAELLGGEEVLQRGMVGDELGGVRVGKDVVAEVFGSLDDA